MKMVRQNGFTLIEVLIAMTLLSVMVVLLFSSLRTAAESWNAGESKVAAVNQKAVVYQFFKRHLTAIRPVPMLNDEQNQNPEALQAFQGYSQSLRFVAALPVASTRKGLQLFTIALDPADTSSLLVSLLPYRETEEDAQYPPDKPEVLLENIAELKFSYFGKTEDAAEARWRDEWTIADRLPSLIMVSIRLADDSYWPDMVFAPKITQANNAETMLGDDLDGSVLDANVP